MSALDQVYRTYSGSDGEATKALYAQLEQLGPVGIVAVNLFRACKTSERAKEYRRGAHRHEAYGRKNWSLENLSKVLTEHAAALKIVWGWGYDEKTIAFEHVLYVEIPNIGQLSFHCGERFEGPDYPGEWDGMKGSGPGRICVWAARLLEQKVAA